MDRVGFLEPIMPGSLAAADVSGNLPAEVKAQDNIDFGALQKASITAAVPASSAIASQVRVELATELAVIDSLAPTDHHAPAAADPILDENDDPIQGAKIYAYSDSDRTTLVAASTTDANGLWDLYFSEAGTYYVRCVVVGYDPLEWTEVVS